jgi:hypothetical protein
MKKALTYRQRRAPTAIIDGGGAEYIFGKYQELPKVDIDGGTPHGYMAGSLLLKEPVFYVAAQALPYADVFVDEWQVLDAVDLLEISNNIVLDQNLG